MRESSQSFNGGTLCGRAWTFSAGLTGPRNLGIILGSSSLEVCSVPLLAKLAKKRKKCAMCAVLAQVLCREGAGGVAPRRWRGRDSLPKFRPIRGFLEVL